MVVDKPSTYLFHKLDNSMKLNSEVLVLRSSHFISFSLFTCKLHVNNCYPDCSSLLDSSITGNKF